MTSIQNKKAIGTIYGIYDTSDSDTMILAAFVLVATECEDVLLPAGCVPHTNWTTNIRTSSEVHIVLRSSSLALIS